MDTNTQAPYPVEIAAIVAVVELLIQPEFGDDFIRDACDTAGFTTISDDDVEAVTAAVIKKQKEMVRPLIAQLPADLQETYTDYLNRH